MPIRSRTALAPILVVLFLALGTAAAPAEEVVYARNLSLSPDGTMLAFRWAGDIWTVGADGGHARRLTAHPGFDDNPVWSRDGRRIAFSSDRHGAENVFVMNADGTDVRRLTFGDQSETPTCWTPEGDAILAESRREGQVFWEPLVYRVPLEIGQLWPALDCFAADAQVSPDGRWTAFTRGRSRWWRRGYRGSANHDIWLRDEQKQQFRQLTDFDGTDRLPRWSEGSRGLYFLSDRAGSLNVWFQPLDGPARQITRMTDDDVRDLAVSTDGRTLAFTHWDKLYVLSLPDGTPREIRVTAGGDSATNPVDLRTYRNDADEVEASPAGDELALVVRGEIYVVKAVDEEKPTRRVTEAPYRDRQVVWSPDGKALFFISDREGQEDIYRAVSAEFPARPLSESLRFRIDRVTADPAPEFSPQVSPDGRTLGFVRGRGDLIIRDLKSGEEQRLFESWNPPNYRWSPDSKWIAYEREDDEFNPDVWIAPADGGSAAVNISQHPDYDGNPQWSADGRVLAFASRREGMDTDLYLVFLSPKLEQESSVELQEYFKTQGDKVKKRKPLKSAVASGKIRLAGEAPTTQPAPSQPASAEVAAGADEIRGWLRKTLKSILEEPKDEEKQGDAKKDDDYPYELDTAFRRVRRVTSLPADQSNFALSPDGSLLAFTSGHEGDGAALFQVAWNGEDRKKIVSGGAGALQWQLDGSRLFYLKGGVPGSCKAGGGDSKTYRFAAKMAVDHRAEARQKFDDAARALGLRFYHSTMKDLDWTAKTGHYRELALRTQTIEEFNEIFNMLQGELNASHLGIYPPGGRSGDRVGYLGCRFDPDFEGPGLRVKSITPYTPADRAESRLFVGDVILAVGGVPVGPNNPIERALIDSVGDPVILTVVPSPLRKAASQPSSTAAASAPDAPGAGVRARDDAAEQVADGKSAAIDIVIRPTSYGDFANSCYDAWVEANRKYVEEKSGGRVGYCHIRGMGEASFNVFERDLYAAAHGRDGLIIDVRNNGGGWTADWVMAVLNVRRHAYTIPRGGARGYPQDRLIFYSWVKPTTMMCNQYSYSNAEIVSHAFKNLDRGPLVGMTTFGAVISTGAYGLIDGGRIRMPFRGWYTLPAGDDMELHGAEPDIKVPVTPADEVSNRYPQLDAAIRATLDEIAKSPG